MLGSVITDVGTELSFPMDMIKLNIPFSLLTAYQILAFDNIINMIWVAMIISIMCAQMCWHIHVVHNCSELFFDYCGANFNRKHS